MWVEEARTSIRRRGQMVRTRTVNAAITGYIDSPTISRTADSRAAAASETTCLHTSSSFSHSNVPWTPRHLSKVTAVVKRSLFADRLVNDRCDVLSTSLAVVTFHVRSSTLLCKYAVTRWNFEIIFVRRIHPIMVMYFLKKVGYKKVLHRVIM